MKIALPLFAASLLVACGPAIGASDEGGPSGTRSFDATGFTGVALGGPDNVRIVAGKTFAVSATGPEKVLDRLDITVKDGTLKIIRKRQGIMSSNRGPGAVITVTMPYITRAAIGGSGDMDVDAPATGDFEGAIGGSGNLRISLLSAEKLDLAIGGSGDIRAKGSAKSVDLSIAGSGSIDTSDVQAIDLSASIAGSGDITASATGQASASIVGSGDIRVKGTNQCKSSKVGSGTISCSI